MQETLGETIPLLGFSYWDLLTAVIVLLVGLVLVKMIGSVLARGLKKSKLPDLMVEFLTRLATILLYVVVVLAAASVLGFDTSSVVLGLSAVVGLVLGFGMQDTMTSFFAGVWLTAIRPFKVSDYVEVAGHSGSIKGVGMLSTELLTPDNKFITIPNKSVWGSPITNYTRMDTRRVDIKVGTSYSGDLEKAISVAMKVMRDHPLVLEAPEPSVVVSELADSSVNITLFAWTNTGNYWTVKGDLTREIFDAYNTQGVEIPFPQMDVHLDKWASS
ncbi:MAG: mechanosensitive ion channel family protein [Methanocrinis sp.]